MLKLIPFALLPLLAVVLLCPGASACGRRHHRRGQEPSYAPPPVTRTTLPPVQPLPEPLPVVLPAPEVLGIAPGVQYSPQWGANFRSCRT